MRPSQCCCRSRFVLPPVGTHKDEESEIYQRSGGQDIPWAHRGPFVTLNKWFLRRASLPLPPRPQQVTRADHVEIVPKRPRPNFTVARSRDQTREKGRDCCPAIRRRFWNETRKSAVALVNMCLWKSVKEHIPSSKEKGVRGDKGHGWTTPAGRTS